MQNFIIEHTYGCGSNGTLEIEAETMEDAYRIAQEEYFLSDDDIVSVQTINEAEAA